MTLYVGRLKSNGGYIVGYWATSQDLQKARIFTRKNDVTRCRPHGCDKEDVEFVEVILAIAPTDTSQRPDDTINTAVLGNQAPPTVDLIYYNPSSLLV